MAMNFAPLDCSCQGVSSEPKKIYLDFSVLEKFAKNQKNPYFCLPQQNIGSMAGTFTIPEFNSSYTITDSNLVRIGDKKFLEKNHVLSAPTKCERISGAIETSSVLFYIK
jgi:hypothetical protein